MDRRPTRQDTFDLRQDNHLSSHSDIGHYVSTDDEEHSVLEDDSDGEERDVDYMDEDDDGSSSLSIPNESIDFDLVYSLHSFAATVEGQANVVKGDSLILMDDSNSYWWLVRVLKTQEVGYIPAENIETPFERLARLNKHRNVDVRDFSCILITSLTGARSLPLQPKQSSKRTFMPPETDFETTFLDKRTDNHLRPYQPPATAERDREVSRSHPRCPSTGTPRPSGTRTRSKRTTSNGMTEHMKTRTPTWLMNRSSKGARSKLPWRVTS